MLLSRRLASATLRTLAVTLGLTLLVPSPGWAAFEPPPLVNGTLVDASGAPLAGVEVKIGTWRATTSQSGYFGIPNAWGDLAIGINGVVLTGYADAGSSGYSFGKIKVPTNATEPARYTVVDAAGNPVPDFRFSYLASHTTGGGSCPDTVKSSAQKSLDVSCAGSSKSWWLVTDANGQATGWMSSGVDAAIMTTVAGGWTDPYGVERAYSQEWGITRSPGENPPVTLATTLAGVNVVPRATLSGSTATGTGCGQIELRWTPIADATLKAEVSTGGTNVDTFELNAASGSATLNATDPAAQRHYSGCGTASGFKPGHYLVRLTAPNVALPTDLASVQVGELPLLEGSAAINAGATVTGGVRSATVRWKPLIPPDPEPWRLILTAAPVSGTSPEVGVCPDYTASSAVFTDLAPGVTYRVTMTGTNAIGARTVVLSQLAKVTGPPGKVSGLKAKRKGKTVTLTWKPAVSHGSPIMSYKITGSKKATTLKTKVVFKRLKHGTYEFRVTAVNKYGSGVDSKVKVKVR